MKPKAIVHLGRNVQRGKRLVGYIYRDKAKVAIGGFLPGGVTGDPSQDYESLLMGHHGAGRLIRNVIISLNCPTSDEWIERHAAGLGRCADEFCERFAPDRPYVWAVHRNGAKLHCHVLPQNSSNEEKCLDWGPEILKEMQDFRWSYEFESGRGHGKNQMAGKTVYPGKSTLAAQLAGLDVEGLKSALDAGDLAVTRTRKDGSPLSVSFEGKKIRVQTINTFSAEFAARLVNAMNDADDGTYLLGMIEQNRAAKQQVRRGLGR